MISKITKVRLSGDRAAVEWVDERGQSGTTEGEASSAHMQALIQRAQREGVTIQSFDATSQFSGVTATCPYCLKPQLLERGQMPQHRARIGECDGAGRKVVSMDAGRAVLAMAGEPYNAFPQGGGSREIGPGNVSRGDRLRVVEGSGSVIVEVTDVSSDGFTGTGYAYPSGKRFAWRDVVSKMSSMDAGRAVLEAPPVSMSQYASGETPKVYDGVKHKAYPNDRNMAGEVTKVYGDGTVEVRRTTGMTVVHKASDLIKW